MADGHEQYFAFPVNVNELKKEWICKEVGVEFTMAAASGSSFQALF